MGVEGIGWYRREGTVDVEGIGIEFERRAKEMGASSPEPQSKSEALNADLFKYVADKLVQESGVIPLMHSVAIDVMMDGHTIQGIITHSKAGRGAVRARRVIDASGDADIAYFTGAPTHKT